MSKWYYKVVDNLENIVPCIEYFTKELDAAKVQLSLKGKSIERHSSELPGIFEERFAQLQEVEAILEYLNIKLSKKRSDVFKKFLEHYQRALTSRDCEKYVDGDDEVVDMTLLVNEFSLVRNRYLALIKGLDSKGWQISHLTKLKAAGMEDYKID